MAGWLDGWMLAGCWLDDLCDSQMVVRRELPKDVMRENVCLSFTVLFFVSQPTVLPDKTV